MIAWPDVEAALQGRVGREYHGPCPVSGAGRACCFASEGRAGDVALGCRKCGGNGGKLESESFLAHLAALVGETARHVAAHATNDRAAIATTPSALPGRAWLASEPVDGTPGHTYLVARRVWPAGERFPASVHWLPTESARRVGVRPRVPDGAAGCVVYRFGSPGEADTNAAQLEAVNAHGERVPSSSRQNARQSKMSSNREIILNELSDMDADERAALMRSLDAGDADATVPFAISSWSPIPAGRAAGEATRQGVQTAASRVSLLAITAL